MPGVVSDHLMMIVNTRPGTNWPETEYAHVGYNVESIELTPSSGTQTVYDFTGISNVPAQVSVFVIDNLTNYSTRLYADDDYTIDWINKTVNLVTPLASNTKLRLDIYEVGNGDQLVKSNTDADPIRYNTSTGFSEIELNCNYTGLLFNGGGIVRPGSQPITIIATATNSTTDSVFVDDVSDFILNGAISFSGATFGSTSVNATSTVSGQLYQILTLGTSDFTLIGAASNTVGLIFVATGTGSGSGTLAGGIIEDATYYVKSISMITNSITISGSLTGTGIAGPTQQLATDLGTMGTIIQVGIAATWTPPLVYHNGTKLIQGTRGTIFRTNASNNSLTTVTVAGLVVNDPIVFCNCMFEGGLQSVETFATDIIAGRTYRIVTIGDTDYTLIGAASNTVGLEFVATGTGTGNGLVTAIYYINSIIDSNEFTVKDTPSGSIIPLTNATGSSLFITNDYAIGQSSNDVSAKVIFSHIYDTEIDYLVYSFFNQTVPVQYGYTLPETELFTGDGVTTLYNLSNFVGGTNSENAIVEIDGLRQTSANYTINSSTETITFDANSVPSLNSVIAVTTFNDTERQYLNTQFGIENNSANVVMKITNIENSLSLPVITNVSQTANAAGGNVLTAQSTTGFIAGQTIQFKGIPIANVQTDGTVYFVSNVVNSTDFTICTAQNEVGNVALEFDPGNGLGLMQATVGGLSAVRVTTSVPHDFVTNDIVRIDGTQGSIQLNNNTYYAHVIDATRLDLYLSAYSSSLTAINDPVTSISTWTTGGFVWVDGTFILATQIATATSSTGNLITVADTSQLIVDTPVLFTEKGTTLGSALLGGIVAGTTYYIKEIVSGTTFTISETRGGDSLTLSDSTGTMNVQQWQQDNVDRLWVTVDGSRIPSSQLRINPGNYISILAQVDINQEVIISSMMPSATPDQEIYLLSVDGVDGVVYRDNIESRSWLTKSLFPLETIMYVNDVTRLVNTLRQTSIAPAAVDGITSIGLSANKNDLIQVSVYNETTGQDISPNSFIISIVDLSPTLEIVGGVSSGDTLTITMREAKLLLVNGEEIIVRGLDLANNALTNLQRGANGTAIPPETPIYSTVYSLLEVNKMTQVNYDRVWNSYIYNTVEGDPLQISETSAADFLRTDDI